MMLRRHLATVLSVTMVMMVRAGRAVIITALRVLLALKCLLRIRFQAGDLFRSQFAEWIEAISPTLKEYLPAIVFFDVTVTIATPTALYSCCWNLCAVRLSVCLSGPLSTLSIHWPVTYLYPYLHWVRFSRSKTVYTKCHIAS